MEIARRDVLLPMLAVGLIATVPALAESPDEIAVAKNVEAFRQAQIAADLKELEALCAAELSYSHSDARVEDKAKFIDGVMTRKAVLKSIEFPDLTVAIAANNAIVRHLWVSESELDGKITNTKIGVLQVWQKQDSGWKLLARASFRLPQPTEKS
jgi:sulfur carrier protein ThiS